MVDALTMGWCLMETFRNILITILILMLIGAVAFSCDDFAYDCKWACKHDGDETYWVDKGVCYCGNKRPLDRKIINLQGAVRGKAIIKPEQYWGNQ